MKFLALFDSNLVDSATGDTGVLSDAAALSTRDSENANAVLANEVLCTNDDGYITYPANNGRQFMGDWVFVLKFVIDSFDYSNTWTNYYNGIYQERNADGSRSNQRFGVEVTDTKFKFELNGVKYSDAAVPLSTGTWYQAVLRYDAANLRMEYSMGSSELTNTMHTQQYTSDLTSFLDEPAIVLGRRNNADHGGRFHGCVESAAKEKIENAGEHCEH
ncbi:hypothetical protein CYMTET_52982 [Cymbomonas tetramitiformis]|uniref:Uncharacterized protein n=1 Tax=Cymbomonas tetramitiformis TaxID=36881 RepID=A0AAE0ER22_9CHLO|nr:hypothetical protein CYMTET_52982 [Cymbomonas tetramitiformis]